MAVVPRRRAPGARIRLALRRARGPIVASALTYVTFVVVGIVLATAGWPPAVDQRDGIVRGAQAGAVLRAYRNGDRLGAAIFDFGSNVLLGALPTSVMGVIVVGPFPVAAYRGWVGGIVSIDARHHSRLATPAGARYYLITLGLQLIGFVLTMGAGVHVGLSAWRIRHDPNAWQIGGLRMPTFALADAAWIYVVATPVFLIASLWEFFA